MAPYRVDEDDISNVIVLSEQSGVITLYKVLCKEPPRIRHYSDIGDCARYYSGVESLLKQTFADPVGTRYRAERFMFTSDFFATFCTALMRTNITNMLLGD